MRNGLGLYGDQCICVIPRHPPSCMPPCHTPATHAPPYGQTDTCKNITFPQLLLRAVKSNYCLKRHDAPFCVGNPGSTTVFQLMVYCILVVYLLYTYCYIYFNLVERVEMRIPIESPHIDSVVNFNTKPHSDEHFR